MQGSCTVSKNYIHKNYSLVVLWTGELLYLSGFSTEYISRPDICAVYLTHPGDDWKNGQNELMKLMRLLL